MESSGVPAVPSPEASTSVTEGTVLPIQDQDTTVSFCGESNGTLPSPAGKLGLHGLCGSEPRIVGNTTGITEAGCVTGSPDSWWGEGQRIAVGQGHQISPLDCVKIQMWSTQRNMK